MFELSGLLHEISVAFGCSCNLRTLLRRLADGMARHLPIVELEAARLLEHLDEVRIAAYAPETGRRWEGRRSARYLERQDVITPTFVAEEMVRVASAPVAAKLKIPVGHAGLLVIATSTEIPVLMGTIENTDILVDSLMLHCARLGQLTATASRCRAAHHREFGEEEHDISVDRPSEQSTEIPLINPRTKNTDISVETLDTALIRCISTALAHTEGKIYGPGGAAELLGLKPSTLQSKMRKLGIERSDFAPRG